MANITKLAECLFVTEQMNWRKGLKVLGERGEGAIEKELQQIHNIEGFQPKHWHKLTREERVKALKYLMYLKEKKDGKIKEGDAPTVGHSSCIPPRLRPPRLLLH